MFCKKCGAQISDDSVFCKKCGEKLVDMTTAKENENRNNNKLVGDQEKNTLSKPTLKKPLVIGIALVAVLCFIFIGVFIGKKIVNNSESYSSSISSETEINSSSNNEESTNNTNMQVSVEENHNTYIEQKESADTNHKGKWWPDGVYVFDGGPKRFVEAYEFAAPDVLYSIREDGSDVKYSYKYVDEQMLIKPDKSDEDWAPIMFDYDPESETLIYTNTNYDKEYYKYNGSTREEAIVSQNNPHFEIDDVVKNSELTDGYVQFGDMVFQCGCHMTVDDVKKVIESSKTGIGYEEYFEDGGIPAIKAVDSEGKNPIKFSWKRSYQQGSRNYNFGELDVCYLAFATIGSETSCYDDTSIYIGPSFQYCTNNPNSNSGKGIMINGVIPTRTDFLDYLTSISAEDHSNTFNEYWPLFYKNKGQEWTDLTITDFSLSDKLRDDDGMVPASFISARTYKFEWNPDGTLGGFRLSETMADYHTD